MAKSKRRININDGFNSELAKGAEFVGRFELPNIRPLNTIIIPKHLIPFSERNKANYSSETFVMFYEHDDHFAELVAHPGIFVDDLRRFAGVVSPDNSLYRDMPFSCQLCNIYRNRLIGSFLQRNGINVIANCRWGDERTYTDSVFGEPAAFVGLPKNNVVSVGTYGCIQSEDDKYYFKKGLNVMLDYLNPEVVIVYGAMPDSVFADYIDRTKFVNYKDWMAVCHRKDDLWGAA